MSLATSDLARALDITRKIVRGIVPSATLRQVLSASPRLFIW